MSATPQPPKSADAGAAPVEPPLEERLRLFWKKNGGAVLTLCAAVAIAIAARGIMQYMAEQKEISLEQAYAAAATPEALRAFAGDNTGTDLAGLAELRLADSAYSAGRATEAVVGYGTAVNELKTGPLAARARLGLAMAQIEAGQTSEGATALQQFAADAAQPAPLRAEAAYNLASEAASAGNSADVEKYASMIYGIEPNGPWMQRVYALYSRLPPAPAPTARNAPVPAGSAK
jgi:predicted negative regulator of RcsB-dependent stress response